MPTRTAYAEWEGGLKKGTGNIKTDSGKVEVDYNFSSRFEEEPLSNPEELLAAAHASCFSMALAAALEKEGYPPEKVVTAENATIEEVEGEFEITQLFIHTEAVAQGLNDDRFQEIAEEAKDNCPVSKALQSVPLQLRAVLKDV